MVRRRDGAARRRRTTLVVESHHRKGSTRTHVQARGQQSCQRKDARDGACSAWFVGGVATGV